MPLKNSSREFELQNHNRGDIEMTTNIKATVYICSPFRAKNKDQLELHIEYAKELSRQWVLKGFSVITPHLYYTNFLDDNDELQRELGLASARELILKCDFVVAGVEHGISDGMGAELNFAHKHNIPVYIVRHDKDIEDFKDIFIPGSTQSEDVCKGCIHKPNDTYLEACGECRRFYADNYTTKEEE